MSIIRIIIYVTRSSATAETLRQLRTSFSDRSLIAHFTEHTAPVVQL